MNDSESVIMAEAVKIREFLETEGKHLSRLLADFPKGACGNASDLLAEWLIERGFNQIDYVWGQRLDQSHGWLKLEGLIVDITADAFPGGPGPVFVGRQSEFHDSFRPIRVSSPELSPILREVYGTLRNRLGS